MRGLLFLFAIYGLFVVHGINVAEARGGGRCDGSECTEQADPESWAEQDARIAVTKIEMIIAQIDETIGIDRLMQAFEEAAQTHPQLRELVLILQEYGILTEVSLDGSDGETLPPESDPIP